MFAACRARSRAETHRQSSTIGAADPARRPVGGSALFTAAAVVAVLAIAGCGDDTSGESANPPAVSPSAARSTAVETSPAAASSTPPETYTHFDHIADLPISGGSRYEGQSSTVETDGEVFVADHADDSDLVSFDRDGAVLGTLDFPEEGASTQVCTHFVTPAAPGKVFIVEMQTLPAQGLDDVGARYDLVTYDTAFTEQDRATLIDRQPIDPYAYDEYGCSSAALQSAPYVALTLGGDHLVLDLDTGRTRPASDEQTPVGRYFAQQSCTGECVVYVTDPADGTVVFKVSVPMGADVHSVGKLLYDHLEAGDTLSSADGEHLYIPSGRVWDLDLATGKVTPFSAAAWQKGPTADQSAWLAFLGDESRIAAVPQWAVNPDGSNLLALTRGAAAADYTVDGVTRLCGADDDQVAVLANEQLVLLDAGTGDQVDFTDAITSCDGPVFNGRLIEDASLVQLLD